MSYRIAVCIKPVPDPNYYDKITIDPVRKTITRDGIPTIINPVDKNALEAALQVRDKFGGKVIVFAMAPPNAVENLRETLAMGADEAVLLSDRAFAGADTRATSYVLAKGLEKVDSFDLVFTGTESADGATSQVPAQLAQWLGLPHLFNVKALNFLNEEELEVQSKIENGLIDYLLKLPALLAVSRELNKPRYTTVMGLMKAKKKQVTVYSSQELELDSDNIGLKGSPTQPGDIYTQALGRKGQVLLGEPDAMVAQLIQKLQAAGIAL